jgi:hypothetical protein
MDMGTLIRDNGDPVDQDRPATYTSDTRRTYRLLPSTETPDAWHIYPSAADFRWLCGDSYLAVPQYDEEHGNCYGYAVHMVHAGRRSHEPVGYAQNLLDVCEPAEEDLIRTMNRRPAA